MRLRCYIAFLVFLVPVTTQAQFVQPDGTGVLLTSGWEHTSSFAYTDVPTRILLEQNYPNPFTESTQIRFSLPEAMSVSLRVLNVLGREVRVLVNGRLEAGTHEADFIAADLPAGIYLYRLEAGDQVQVRRMLIVR